MSYSQPKHLISVVIILFLANMGWSQQFDWVKQITGNSSVQARELALDNSGNIYILGNCSGDVDFDPGINTYNLTLNLGAGFISKYDSLGSFLWVKVFEGATNMTSIEIANNGDIFFTGGFFGAVDFDPGVGVVSLTPVGTEEAFICKLDVQGSLVSVVRFEELAGGTSIFTQGYDLVIDDSNNVFVTGNFEGTVDFDPELGTNFATSAGADDIFLARLDSSLLLTWVQTIGGTSNDRAHSIDLNSADELVITGHFMTTADFDPGVGNALLTATSADIFIAKYSTQGDFIWAKKIGGSLNETGNAVVYDQSGNIYTVGNFKSNVDFDPGAGSFVLSASSYSFEAFICKLDSGGNFLWAKDIDASGLLGSRGVKLAVDDLNNPYMVGQFYGVVDFDDGPAIQSLTTYGAGNDLDIFILKLDSMGSLNWVKQIGGISVADVCNGICVDANFNVFTTGHFGESVDFDTGTDTLELYSQAIFDVFFHKLAACPQVFSIIDVESCNNYLPPSQNILYSNSGTFVDVINSENGCDSVITINLSLVNNSSSQISVSTTNCNAYVSPSGLYTWNESGQYSDTVVNAVGCDSIISIALTTNQSFNAITLSACDSYTSPSGNYSWSLSGLYSDTILNGVGCDSIISIDLTISTQSFGNISIESCESYSSPSGNYVWTTSGQYSDTLLNVQGCDSIISINATVYPSVVNQIYAEECDTYISSSGLYAWDTSGVYHDTLSTIYGCDSILEIHLTIENLSADINWNGSDLEATPSNAVAYQWLDCDLNFALISNEQDSIFSPFTNGSYAVEITTNGCLDTSTCFVVNTIGLGNFELNGISVYPIPSEGIVLVNTSESSAHFSLLRLCDRNGRILQELNVESTTTSIDLRDLSKGVYFIQLISNLQMGCVKVVKL